MDFRLAMQYAHVMAGLGDQEEAAVYLRQAVLLYPTWHSQFTLDDPSKLSITNVIANRAPRALGVYRLLYSSKWSLEAMAKAILKKVLPEFMLSMLLRWQATLRKARRG
jgi:hypothetical protein